MARNRVSAFQTSLANFIPNLSTLVLTGNHLTELADLDPLSGFTKLTHLILMENPVTRKEVCLCCVSVFFFFFFPPPTSHFVLSVKSRSVCDDEKKIADEIMGSIELSILDLMALSLRSFLRLSKGQGD